MKIEFTPIGYVRSPLVDRKQAPRHHSISEVEGVIEINPELAEGLFRLEEREFIAVLFYFDKAGREYEMKQYSCGGEGELKGVFSTCSPHRPNPIGLDVVKLIKTEGCKLFVRGIDMLDGTPVLDIKPYKPI